MYAFAACMYVSFEDALGICVRFFFVMYSLPNICMLQMLYNGFFCVQIHGLYEFLLYVYVCVCVCVCVYSGQCEGICIIPMSVVYTSRSHRICPNIYINMSLLSI